MLKSMKKAALALIAVMALVASAHAQRLDLTVSAGQQQGIYNILKVGDLAHFKVTNPMEGSRIALAFSIDALGLGRFDWRSYAVVIDEQKVEGPALDLAVRIPAEIEGMRFVALAGAVLPDGMALLSNELAVAIKAAH